MLYITGKSMIQESAILVKIIKQILNDTPGLVAGGTSLLIQVHNNTIKRNHYN
jgi:hypothetical protein